MNRLVKLPKQQCFQTTMVFLIGLTAGLLLWGLNGSTMWQPSLARKIVIDQRHIYQVQTTKPQDILEEETKELQSLLQRKFQEMEDAGMLEGMGEQRFCTENEATRSLCIDPNCTDPLPPVTSRENIRSVMKPLRKIGMDKLREVIQAFDLNADRKKYVIVTAASSNHFSESQASIQELHKTVLPHISNYSFYYYDLGLQEKERQLVREFSGAELRSFPFDKLPPHVGHIQCYTWKALIILAHLQHSEFLLWMDTSINFTKNIDPYFYKASKTGFIITRNRYVMAQHTVLPMFSYFGDKPCQFSIYNEVESGIIVFHNEPFIRRLIVEPWGACAVDPDCMCPVESRTMLKCPWIRKYGVCHRFEQTTLGYLAIKLYREKVPSVYIKNFSHIVRRKKGTFFFDLQRNANFKDVVKGV